MRTLDEKLETVKKETLSIDERNNMLLTQIVQLVAQKQEQASDFAQAEQQKRDELEPRIREREEEIAKLKEELKEDELKIRKA